MQAIIDFLNFLTPYGIYSYLVMFLVLLACGFGLPLPEDVVLISGGILTARGVCSFWVTNLVCLVGVLVGDGIIFFLGRRYGATIKSSFLFRHIMTEKVDHKISNIFARYGDKVVFMARFMPGLRMPIYLTAGTYKLSPLKFFALDGFAALISVPIWVWVGYIFGDNFELLERKIRQFKFGVIGMALTFIAVLIIYHLVKRRFIQKI